MARPGRSAADIDPDAIRSGDRDAFDVLADVWLDRMHDAAQNIVGSADAAARVCGEVLAMLWDHHERVTDDDLSRDSLLLATRTQGLDHLERNGWSAPADSPMHWGGGDGSESSPIGASTIAARVELAHVAAAVLGARDVSLADLHHRHGIDGAVLATALKVPDETALRRLSGLRIQLDGVLGAYVLWNRGRPTCPGLAGDLGASADFDSDVFDGIGRHRSICDTCARAHRALVNPASMFLAAPIRSLAPPIRHLAFALLADSLADRTVPRPAMAAPTVVAPALFAPAVVAPAPVTAAVVADSAPALPPDDVLDLADLWETSAAVKPTAPAPSPVATIVPVRRHPRRRGMVAYVAGGTAAAVLMGGAVFGLTGSVDEGPTVVDRSPALPALDADEPEARSLGPIPPPTASETSTSTTSTSTTTPETTSTIPDSIEPVAVQPAPTTAAGTQVATGTPPAPTAPTVTTPPATTAAPTTAPVTSAPTTAPPATTAAPTTTTTTVAPTTTTTTAATTTTTVAPTTTTTVAPTPAG